MPNGEPGPPIWHRCGLRQGDPISPQLFVLAVDILGRLISRTHDAGILQRLHPRRDIPAISLYADDVMLFCHATQGDVEAVRAILAIFSEASGLRVNYAKSSATWIRRGTAKQPQPRPQRVAPRRPRARHARSRGPTLWIWGRRRETLGPEQHGSVSLVEPHARGGRPPGSEVPPPPDPPGLCPAGSTGGGRGRGRRRGGSA